MKKLTLLFLSISFIFGLTACGSQTADTGNTPDTGYQSNNTADTTADAESEQIAKGTEQSGNAEESGDNISNVDTYNIDASIDPNQPTNGMLPSNPMKVASLVYMTTDISPESLMAVYEALGVELTGDNIAVKLSTGEPPASNYLDPDLIQDLVQHVNGTIVECNTAYGGSRSETDMHYQVAEDHGFTEIADFVIMDEDGSMVIPVEGGKQLTENYVGARFGDFDGFLVLTHFKGHAMAGFGGAIKNISIGIASQEGKNLIHTAGKSHTSMSGGEQDAFLESMADAAKSVTDYLDGNIIYINVMNRLSIDCDCNGNPAEPDIHDIGILASRDPVALDQACVDLIYKAEGNEAFVNRMESLNAQHVLEAGAEIGLGMRNYVIVNVDQDDNSVQLLY